jgi:hypothetical protein
MDMAKGDVIQYREILKLSVKEFLAKYDNYITYLPKAS